MKRPCICILAGFALGVVLAYAIIERNVLLATFQCIAALVICAVFLLDVILSGSDKKPVLILLGIALICGFTRLAIDKNTLSQTDSLNALCTGSDSSYDCEITGITVKGSRLNLRCGELIVYYTPDREQLYYKASDEKGTTVSSSHSKGSDYSVYGKNDSAAAGLSASHQKDSVISTTQGESPGPAGDIAAMFSIGNHIHITGDFDVMDRPRNPGEFNYYLYYRADGVTHRCFADSVEITDRHVNRISDGLFRLRRKLLRRIDAIYSDDDSGVLRAVLLGDKSELNEDINDLYRKNGIAHLLAISGLHVSIIGMSLYSLLRKRLRLPYAVCGLVGGSWILFYCLLTGAGVSTVRATVMLLMMFLAGSMGMHYDMLNSAGFAAILILLIHPYQLFNCAFLLSFTCIAAIAGPAKLIIDELNIKNAILKSLVMSIAIQLFTLPVTAYFFFEVSPYGCLLNLIVIPLMTIVVWSSLIATLITFIWPIAAIPAATVSHYILTFYTWLGSITIRLPGSTILIGRPSLWQIFAYYCLFFLVLYSSRLRVQIHALLSSMSDRGTASTSTQGKTYS